METEVKTTSASTTAFTPSGAEVTVEQQQPPVLSVRNLDVTYRTSKGKGMLKALRNVSFDLRPGESLGILGESGAGKSTIANSILCLIEPPDKISGEIIYDGKSMLTANGGELRRYRWNKVAVVFQAAMNSLDPVVTVGKSFNELLLDKKVARSRGEAKELSKKLLKDMELPDSVVDMYPFELSGGMKQRVIIAMALSTDPKILILDEPTTALDTITQFSVLATIKKLKADSRLDSLILITHDPAVHAFMVSRLLIMLKGVVVEDGPIQEIMTRPKHPYSQLLLGTLPLVPKRGSIWEKQADDSCPFTRFCPYVMEKCRERMPKLFPVGEEGHRAACFLYGS